MKGRENLIHAAGAAFEAKWSIARERAEPSELRCLWQETGICQQAVRANVLLLALQRGWLSSWRGPFKPKPCSAAMRSSNPRLFAAALVGCGGNRRRSSSLEDFTENTPTDSELVACEREYHLFWQRDKSRCRYPVFTCGGRDRGRDGQRPLCLRLSRRSPA